MPLTNTTQTYGSVARTLHWLTALLILTAIPLGLIANQMPYDTSDALAAKAQLFSWHKTLGVAAFAVALARILWALIQPHPAPLHPERRIETFAAQAVHWSLYIALLLVPLSGWVHHAATTGFAPILWPLGQTLPLVPQSTTVAAIAASVHWVFTKVLAASILLHIAGALKHHLIDRDDTLRRMTSGRAPRVVAHRPARGPVVAALAIYAAGAGLALALVEPQDTARGPALAAVASDWVVTEGTLGITVEQMGQDVTGSFGDWTAQIAFDPVPTDGVNGSVTVTIATDSITLGGITPQAKTAEFLHAAAFPTATFTATIRPAEAGYVADGTLSLRGVTVPVALPFTLILDGDTARMTGTVALDRRPFGVGSSYPDETSVGFQTLIAVELTATRGGN